MIRKLAQNAGTPRSVSARQDDERDGESERRVDEPFEPAGLMAADAQNGMQWNRGRHGW
jgi:hypothetical protein